MEVGRTCELCPRRCGVPRGEGFCGAPAELQVSSVCLHRGEEPPISGQTGIVNVFFSHCNLQCIYCQNWQISGVESGEWRAESGERRAESGEWRVESGERRVERGEWRVESGERRVESGECRVESVEKLAETICDTLSSVPSSNTIPSVGFVTAAHYIDRIPAIVEEIRRRGFSPTFVYNSSGYESVEALQTLDGYIDVYLPDLKYMDADIAARYSHAPDYPQVAVAALLEMRRQVGGGLKMGDDGMAYRGMLVRHLVLPGAVQNAIACLDWLADNMPFSTGVSLMAQYFPPRPGLPAPLDRRLTQQEYDEAVDYLNRLPFNNVWTQELCSQDNYRPDFSALGNPFER